MEHKPIIKPKLEKEYELEFNNSKIILNISLFTSLINISVKFLNDINPFIYENSFDKADLSKINKCFKIFESIDEIMSVFTYLIDNKKYTLNKINENDFELKIKAQLFIKEEEIGLILHKNNNINKDDIINNLCKIVQKLVKRVDELENWKKENEVIIKEIKSNNKDKSKINKINNESNIIEKKEQLNFIEKRLKTGVFENKKISYKLLYCGTKDGDNSLTFHKKCDNIQNQLVLVKTTEGLTFGGYTRLGFNSNNQAITDKDSFLFSFETNKIYNAIEGKETIYCYSSYGPTFGCYSDIKIPNNFFSSQGEVQSKMNRFKTTQDYELNGGNQFFKFKEVEVFQILFE